MTYDPFSVIVVPFPFTDSIKTKRRPAIVLSTNHYQVQTGHITLLMVTSFKHEEWYGDYLIQDLNSAGLPKTSMARQKIFTIDMRFIIKKIGHLSTLDKKNILLNLHKCVHLD